MALHKGSITCRQTLENNIMILRTHQFVRAQKAEFWERFSCINVDSHLIASLVKALFISSLDASVSAWEAK